MPREILIQHRQGTAAEWTSANPILEAGEPAYETDTGKQKIGDGVTEWNSLSYSIDSITNGEPTGSDQVLNVVSLTQAEYDAGTPIATTLYIITDA